MASSKQPRTKPKPQTTGQAKPQTTGQPKAQASGQRPAQRQTQNQRQTQAQTKRARDRARAKELAEERAAAEAAPAKVGPPLWLQLSSLALAIAGLGVSIYLTIEHFTGNRTLACSINSVVNCEAVTRSPESMVFGVFPVAVLGLAFYMFMVPATTPWAWRSNRRELALARLASMVVGVGFIIYLIYVELFQVGFICLWCTSVHAITFLLFCLIALSAAIWGLPETRRERVRARERGWARRR
jgi:uncharacterized membrane protein